MNELNVELLINAKLFKYPIVKIIQQHSINELTDVEDNLVDSLRVYIALLETKVSKISVFGSNEWDFCHENPKSLFASHNYRIDFSCYKCVPETILFEMKCIAFYWLLVGKIGTSSKKKHKTITVLETIKRTLAFFDKVFDYLRCEYGTEFIVQKKALLSDIDKSDIKQALLNRSVKKSSTVNDFLSNKLHDPILVKDVLGKPFLLFCESEYNWTGTKHKPNNLDILPNSVFEECVTSASLLIYDFLSKFNLPINDSVIQQRFSLLSALHSPSIYGQIKACHINAYRVYRLTNAGYDEPFIRKYEVPDDIIQENGRLFSIRMQDRRYWYSDLESLPNRRKIKQYIHVIQGAALFLFLAFTGMRTSELKFIKLNNWEFTTGIKDGRIISDIPQIATRVSKGQDETHGLFHDKWVLIPAVVDALACLEFLSTISQNDYIYSALNKTIRNYESDTGTPTNRNFYELVAAFITPITELKPTIQTMRDTLAYQMFRIDLGLPFISYQLKHLVDFVDKETSLGSVADVTLGYGGIGQILTKNGRIRQKVEREKVESNYDPDGIYYGGKGAEHISRMQTLFQGYIEEGHTKDEVFAALAEQGVGLIDVGGALCYGDRTEEFDPTLPCVGSLRCNPVRCKNAVISKTHLPRWKEIYLSNKSSLDNGTADDNKDAVVEAMQEAEEVIKFIQSNGDDND
ncbi:hypothetical protein [Vibrio alginolyticus]|uniref:hypothetical protein n=1 Tax=Vibrio alginolyticus TaxID=663 RepID=UPI0028FC322C|nr:hypothetical protein [Vibrio alginolyticus]WNW05006.1 hypothetical protein RO483_08480 [Vibrio alginolyticus]